MITVKTLKQKRDEIVEIASRHGVKSISLFGSFARRDARPNSDIDFLIEVEGPTTPWFPGGLVAELEALLGCQVDVVETDALRISMKKDVLKDAIPL